MAEPMSAERLAEIEADQDAMALAEVAELVAEVKRLRAAEQRVREVRRGWIRSASAARTLVNKADAAKHVAGMFAENARAHTYGEVGDAIDAALDGEAAS